MIVSRNGKDVFEVTQALLKKSHSNEKQHFDSPKSLTDYLKQHPDETFLLEAEKLGDELPNGVQPDDIVTGQIAYDSASGKVVKR